MTRSASRPMDKNMTSHIFGLYKAKTCLDSSYKSSQFIFVYELRRFGEILIIRLRLLENFLLMESQGLNLKMIVGLKTFGVETHAPYKWNSNQLI